MTEYYVGQEVLVLSVNSREPENATVTKVGRKLVTVAVGPRGALEEVYRIADGKRNDNYGHEWLTTPEEYAESQHRKELWTRLHELGLKTEWGAPIIPTDKLERIIAILEVI